MNSNVVTIICTILEILTPIIIFVLTLIFEKKKNKLNFYKKFHDMYYEFGQDSKYKFYDFTFEQQDSFMKLLIDNEQYLPPQISKSFNELCNTRGKFPCITNDENLRECDNVANECDKIFDDIKEYIFNQYKKNKRKF